jgi:hypothetical protein
MPRVSLKTLQARLRQPTAQVSVTPFVGTLQSEGGVANAATAAALTSIEDAINGILAQFRSLAETTGVNNRFSIDGEHINHLRASKIDTDDLTIGGSGINANVVGLAGDDHVMLWAGKYGDDYGLWSEILRAGGTNFANAPFRASDSGLEIDDALITLTDGVTGNTIVIDPSNFFIKLLDAVNDASLQLSPSGTTVIHVKSNDSSPSSSYEMRVSSFTAASIGFYYAGDILFQLGGSPGGVLPHAQVSDSGGNPRLTLYDGVYDGFQIKTWDSFNNVVVAIGSDDTAISITNATLGISGKSSSSAVAGSGSALPATPEGYVEVYIDGNARKVPYYRT